MKKLELKQMEMVEGGGWGSLLCRAAFGITGALVGGPAGAMVGGTIGNMLCYSTEAN